jgi:hypothetical protein
MISMFSLHFNTFNFVFVSAAPLPGPAELWGFIDSEKIDELMRDEMNELSS